MVREHPSRFQSVEVLRSASIMEVRKNLEKQEKNPYQDNRQIKEIWVWTRIKKMLQTKPFLALRMVKGYRREAHSDSLTIAF